MSVADDILTLGLKVDLGNIDEATNKLDHLRVKLRETAGATGDLSNVQNRSASATQRFAREANSAVSSMGRLENSIGSMVAKLGGLAAAFASVGTAMSFTRSGVDFNSSLETSRIGIASLITSMVQLGDATGKPLEGMEKYRASQGLAADMMKEIQKLGLETTATTETLVQGVQSIMGPALQAGMALKDIPKFAVQGAQAMQTLGVPLDQMRTELEALLSGNISKTQDILAPKLFADVNGNLGEYIGKLKETGQLIPEIMKRLEPFKLAGQDVAQTWEGLTSNFEEAMQTLAGQSTEGLTKSMKESVSVMSDLILTTEEGSVGISDKFSGIADLITGIESGIGDGILSAVKTVAGAVEALGAKVNEIGADEILSAMGRSAEVASAGLLALVAARKTANSGLAEYVGNLVKSEKALINEKNAAKQALDVARQRVVSYQSQIDAAARYAQANRGAIAAVDVRAASTARMTELVNAATAAEARYTAAVNASSVATRAANALKTAGMGLVNMLGGPLGAAFTAAAVGAALLATRQTEAERAAASLQTAEKAYDSVIKASTDSTGKMITVTQKLGAARAELANQKYNSSLSDYTNAIQGQISGISGMATGSLGDLYAGIAPDPAVTSQLEAYKKKLQEIFDLYKSGKLSASEMAEQFAGVRKEMENSGTASEELKNKMTEVEGATKSLIAAENEYKTATGEAAQLTGEYTTKLTELEKARLSIAKHKLEETIEASSNALREALGLMSEIHKQSTEMGNWWSYMSVPSDLSDEVAKYRQQAQAVFDLFNDKQITASEMRDKLAAIRNEMEEGDTASSNLKQSLDKIIDGPLLDKLVTADNKMNSLTGSISNVAVAAEGAAASIMSMKSALNMQGADDFIKATEKNILSLKTKIAGVGDYEGILKAAPGATPEDLSKWKKGLSSGGRVGLANAMDDFESRVKLTSSDREKIFKMMELGAQKEALDKTWREQQKSASASKSASKAAASAAQKATSAQATYTGEVARTQEKIRSLQEQLSLDKNETYAIASAKAEEKYNTAISKTNEELAKRLANKSLTQSQADELRKMKEQEASLQKQYDLEQAKAKQTQKNVQLAQGQIKFYKELGQLSGKYVDDLSLQHYLIEQQAEEYRQTLNISEDLIQQWVEYSKLQVSTDPFDGAYRGLLKFTSEYGDQAKTWEDLTYNFSKSFVDQTGDMFDEFLETGKISLDGFKDLFKSFLKQLAWQAVAQPIMVNIMGSLMGSSSGGVASAAGLMGGGSQDVFGIASNAFSNAAGSGGSGGLMDMGMGLAKNYGASKLFGGESGLIGGITDGINSAVANIFPSMFQETAGGFAGPITNAAGQVVGQSTVLPTFTSAIGTAGIGGMFGGIASPFVNNLLGIENNSGSQIGSMAGGALGTIGGAMAAGSIAGPIGTVIGGVIGALGAIAGGSIGGLLGTQPKQEPKLEVDLVGSLWKPVSDAKDMQVFDNGGPIAAWDPNTGAYRSAVETSHGAKGAWDITTAYGNVMQQTAEVSWGIADALGTITDDMKTQYLKNLEELGEINIHGIHRGDWITQNNIQAFADWYVGEATGNMLIALSNIDLTPLTIAADGMAADTAEELGTAIGNILSYVNIGQAIEDETMRNNFYDSIEDQMVNALDKVSLAPLAIAADGFAVDTVDELSTALKDVFAAYDLGETIQDEDLKSAYQAKMQELIEHAFDGIDLSFLRVNFDQNSFAGLQQAYAAIQAWEQVEDNINAVLKPTSDFVTQIEAASNQFDEWIKNLKALGWQEEAVAEVEAKRASYMREFAGNLSAEFKAFLNPVSDFETAMQAASNQFDEWIASLDKLGYTQEEIARIENRRTEYLWEYSRAMTKAMEQDLHLRMLALQYGSGSPQYSLQSLKYQQINERESAAKQYGIGSGVYQNLVLVQNAEYLQALLDQLKSMREQAIQNEISAIEDKYQGLIDPLEDQAKAIQATIKERQKEITLLQRAMKPIQKEIQARQKELQAIEKEIAAKEREISEAERVADNFRRIARSLKDVRAELWTGENNLMGTRYQEAYRQFDELYRQAMTGDEDALNELGDKANQVLQLGREQLESRGEYNDAFYDIDQKLKHAQDFASSQVKKSEDQIALLQKQLDALNAQKAPIEAALAELQKQYDKMQEQIEAMQEALEPLNDQLTAIQEQTQILQDQRQAEIAQYQALLAQYQAQQQTNMSLAQINAAIAQVEAALGQYMQQISSQKQYGTNTKQGLLEAQAAYANSIAFEGRTDWNAESTLRRIMQDGTLESWYDRYGKDQGGKVVPYDTNAARQAIVANKVAQLNATAYQGRTNWTAQDFYNAIGGNSAANIDKWYKEYGIKEGISATYEGVAYTNVLLDKNQKQSIKNANDNANMLYGSLNSQLNQSQYMASTLDSIFFTDSSYWGRALGGIDGTHSAIGTMNSNLNGGLNSLTGATGTMNSNINGGFNSTVSGLSTINQNLIGIGNKIGEGGYSGSSVNGSYNGTSTGGGWQGSNVGGSGIGSSVNEYERLPGNTGIYGSHYRTENALLTAKARSLNEMRYEGRTDWTPSSVRQYMSKLGSSVQAWYQQYGRAEGFAEGGITPANRIYMVGERGPELMMSPRQWGVLNNEATDALFNRPEPQMPVIASPEGMSQEQMQQLIAGIALLGSYMRYIIRNTDKTAYNTGKSLDLHRMWNAEGVPMEDKE